MDELPDLSSLSHAQKDEVNFRFLGYELGPMMNKRTQRRYLGVQPSKKAKEQIRAKVIRP